MDTFKVVRAEGTSYEMGCEHGSQCKDMIRYLVRESLPKEIASFGKVDPAVMRERAKEYEPYIRSVAPHLLEEIRGIADGSGIDYEEALMLQCRGELVYSARIEAECTSFALAEMHTSTRQVIVGQNVDLAARFEESGIILCLYPKEGPALMTWTLAGTLGQVGLNSAGLARCGNLLVCPGWRVGLPTTILWRCILEQESVAEAEKFIANTYRAKSNTFVLGDRTGHVSIVETTVDRSRKLEAEDGLLVHTNHYLHPDLMAEERFYDLADSRARLTRLKGLLANRTMPVTEDELKNSLRDHSGYPDSICKHEKIPGKSKTVTSMLLYPESGIMEACPGNPCQSSYAVYHL